MEAYPSLWQEVGASLVKTSQRGPEALAKMIDGATRAASPWRNKIAKSHGNPQMVSAALPYLAKARMTVLAVERTLAAIANGVQTSNTAHEGVKFNLWSGWLIQRLLFEAKLKRKPASMRAFRWLWPFVTQRRLLMPLVQPQGIYCFYSAQLIARLKARIGERQVLEVAAGDGTLSRFLKQFYTG